MGKRTDWTDDQLANAVLEAGGNLTEAARYINRTYKDIIKEDGLSRVTRQNLQTWTDKTPSLTALTDQSKLLVANRRVTLQNTALRRENKLLTGMHVSRDDILRGIEKASQRASEATVLPFWPKQAKGKGLTIELLFSDLQVGKLMDDYNSEVAERRVNEWVVVALDRINQYIELGYRIDRIVLAVLGDVIESSQKHGLQSARACDTGTAEQIRHATEILFQVVQRLSQVGVPMDVICITGNHDWDGHGLFMFNPGKEQLSWPLYKAVEAMCSIAGYDAEFYIPQGAFHVHDIYGTKVLYEHGVGVGANYNQMKNHLAKRTDQLKSYITLFRMGDKHNISQFNNNRLVVNGAFFGDSRSGEEYSGIAGYDGEPAQIMFAHTRRTDDRRTTIFDSLAIQLGHIT